MALNLSSQKIIKDWIDYNGHMNVAYYLLIFDRYGADKLNTIFKMGEESAKTTGMSTMIVENNIAYRQELKVDEEVDINDNLKNRKVYKIKKEKISIMQNFIKENKHNFNDEDLKYSSKLKL